MNILVANLGSTSFKYRLFRLGERDERLLAEGKYENITDYGGSIDDCLASLCAKGHLDNPEDLDGVGFKTVLGEHLTGCVSADENVEAALLEASDLAPAHNPAYAAGIRRFREKMPSTPRVALFETAFYQWMPDYARRYAVPDSWHAAGVRRYGFHGASHKYVAERSAELLGRSDVADIVRSLYRDGPRTVPGAPVRVISCHLGGSSSITAIQDGIAVASSMGLSPQSGVPQNNRVGDLDATAAAFVHKRLKLSWADIERQLNGESGLLGLSGVDNDIRNIRCDALVFTGGIGENNPWLREMVCAGLGEFGLWLDPDLNNSASGEGEVSCLDSRTRCFVIPANEELVVARETFRFLSAGGRHVHTNARELTSQHG